MAPHIRENIFTWLVDWSVVTIMGNTPPPRDPNDDDDEEKKTKRMRTRTRTKNCRSSENRRIAPHIAASVKLSSLTFFRAAGLAWAAATIS